MTQTRLEDQGSPKGWKRLLYRAPIWLYRARLGFIMGQRFLMLCHVGRRSGETRRTVLEVVVNDSDAVFVAAAWGQEAQWLKNIRANPAVTVYLGADRFPTMAEQVDPDAATALMRRYATSHPKALARLAAFMLDEPGQTPEEQAERVAAAVPMVRLPKTT